MTRIVAGRWKGRRLAVPRHGVRPTSERVREAIFNTLPRHAGDLAGLAVLDLYAGSGALGLEALSRGAARALFVESDRAAAAVIRRNIAEVAAPQADVRVAPVAALARGEPPGGTFDVVFADPPYDVALSQIAGVLDRLHGNGWLAADAVVVVETASRAEGSVWPDAAMALTRRDYGDTSVWYGRARTSRPPDHEG